MSSEVATNFYLTRNENIAGKQIQSDRNSKKMNFIFSGKNMFM